MYRGAARLALLALLPLGCAEDAPQTEADVAKALARGFLRPIGDVLMTSAPSDCRTDGETDAPVPAALFGAFLVANDTAEGLNLEAFGGLRVAATGAPPRTVSAEQGEPVLSVSRIGLAGDQALVCVEVFGAQERAFFVLLERTGRPWAVRSEIEVWSELPPEELPGGELYER
jgi:hypothetical protein